MRPDVAKAIEHATTRCSCGAGPAECSHCREAILRSEVIRLTWLVNDDARGGDVEISLGNLPRRKPNFKSSEPGEGVADGC